MWVDLQVGILEEFASCAHPPMGDRLQDRLSNHMHLEFPEERYKKHKAYVEKNRERVNETKRTRRAAVAQLGRCTTCGKPAAPERKKCAGCLAYYKKRREALRARKLELKVSA